MEEKSNVTKLTQKDYQKKYDEKTQSVTIKYTPADMPDYDRMMKYLEKTGKSRSSFIKNLINEFFENQTYYKYEKKIAEYYSSRNVSEEYIEKLKRLIGNEKYNIIMDVVSNNIKDELESVFEEHGAIFEEWIDRLEDDINCKEINIDVSDDKFKHMIDEHLYNSMGTIYYE